MSRSGSSASVLLGSAGPSGPAADPFISQRLRRLLSGGSALCGSMAQFGPLLLLVGPALVLAGVRQPLPVLFMVPVGSGGENLTAGLLPAVSLALQDLERQTEPLGKYQVQLQLLDSQVGVGPVSSGLTGRF